MVTDEQVRTLWTWLGKEASLTFSAAKAGMDRKTARKHRHADQLPSQRAEQARQRTYRTREDPFADVWSEVEALLEESSGWEAKTLLEELQHRHPGKFSEKHLRTMQRRIKQWRATRGPDKEVFFAQEHLPGRLGASDFTHMSDLGVTIDGQPFTHLVYHFVLTHSNWEHVTLCFSESFESFSEGFQNAVWALGGVPAEHRSDRMSLAVQASGSELFTQRYQALMSHYEIKPQAINAGKGHENGDVEQSHHRFKRAVKQALLRRGSHDFPSREAYQAFLNDLCVRRNVGRSECVVEEQKQLRSLPARRLESFRRLKVRVQSGSTITVERNIYSVPARLIDEWVEARLYADTIEVWYGQRKEELLPRLRGRQKHRIDYRHVIGWLVRKPGAFAGYRYRAELFPTSRFRMAYDHLAATASGRAVREYLGILHLAARRSEVEVDEALRRLLDAGGVSLAAVEAMIEEGVSPARTPEVNIEPIDLCFYDELFETKEVWHEAGRVEGREAPLGGLPEGTALADDARGVRAVAEQARQESLSYEHYLLELANRECDERRHKRVERLLKESRLPLEKNLATFDLKRLPAKVLQQVRTLLTGEFVGRKENVLAFGAVGSGKTHLLAGIAQELARQQCRRVYFSRCGLLVQELLAAKQELKLPRLLKRLASYDVVMVDDLGYVQQNREEMEVLFSFFAERYERGSVLLTSNLPFSKWEQIFRDPMTTAAAIDRLVHHSMIVELNLPSYRAEQAKKGKEKHGSETTDAA